MVDIQSHLADYDSRFAGGKAKTLLDTIRINGSAYKRYINEFWTSKQRKASSLHEVSYRACFKPQLPGFFIDLLTGPGDTVFDPFSGRGTTVVEAGLRGRSIISNDINPLSEVFTRPRLDPPLQKDVERRLAGLDLGCGDRAELDLSMFYHPDTERELVALREYLDGRRADGTEDALDRWIRMVATTRLSGHSNGFFSVYSLPPNQAVSQKSQKRINRRLGQRPDYRDVKQRIAKKSRSLLRNLSPEQAADLRKASGTARFLQQDSRDLAGAPTGKVALTVTSPPFLDIVQYSTDNWLRCWFNGLDVKAVEKKITMLKDLDQWSRFIGGTFRELHRLTRENGHVAFEVGEIRKGSVELDRMVVPLGEAAGFTCEAIMINKQDFTKTSNIWGIDNMAGGTNTNRIVIFRREG